MATILTDEELDKEDPYTETEANYRDTALHHRAEAEKWKALARKMARRALCVMGVRYEMDGTFVPKTTEAEECFSLLGLPNPCPGDQFEAALREEEAARG